MPNSVTPEVQQQIANIAVKVEKSHDCPAEVLYAQCAVESKWLKAAPGNNCFGYKEYKGAFGRQLLSTWEKFTPDQLTAFLRLGDGRKILTDNAPNYEVLDWFATFPDLESCFVKRAQRWDAGRHIKWVADFYAATVVYSSADWENLFYLIAKSGYATTNPAEYARACLFCLNLAGSRAALIAARNALSTSIA